MRPTYMPDLRWVVCIVRAPVSSAASTPRGRVYAAYRNMDNQSKFGPLSRIFDRYKGKSCTRDNIGIPVDDM